MRSGIIVFPGTNCDRDTYEACRFFGWDAEYIWHGRDDLSEFDVIFLPGGFSYGDYIRSGRLAKFSPALTGVKNFIKNKRGMVVGICNGFQILCETGLIQGVLTDNINTHFICDEIDIEFNGEILKLPIAHKEGRFLAPKVDEAIKYIKYKNNPNGSMLDIAGLYDKKQNILAMMPHPERAVFKETGNTDGRRIFEFIQENWSE